MCRLERAAGAVRRLPQRPRQWDGQRAQRRHGPKPLRPYPGVEHAGDQGQSGTGGPDADRAIERLRRPFQTRWHDPGKLSGLMAATRPAASAAKSVLLSSVPTRRSSRQRENC